MRKQYFFLLMTVLAVLIGGACNRSTQPVNSSAPLQVDTVEIRKSGQARMAAISAGDTKGYLAAYAEDAVWMPPNVVDLVGKAVAAERLAGVMQDIAINADVETVEQTILSPDWVLERGTYTVVRTTKAGDASNTEVGTYLTIWKRQADQNFKIAYDIWHSDRPPEVEK